MLAPEKNIIMQSGLVDECPFVGGEYDHGCDLQDGAFFDWNFSKYTSSAAGRRGQKKCWKDHTQSYTHRSTKFIFAEQWFP